MLIKKKRNNEEEKRYHVSFRNIKDCPTVLCSENFKCVLGWIYYEISVQVGNVRKKIIFDCVVIKGRRKDGFNFTHGFHVYQQPKIIGQYNELIVLISCFLKSLILTSYQLSDLHGIFKTGLHLYSESEMLEMGSS